MNTISYWNSMLALAGEIGIGIAGFSSVIVALGLAVDEKWHLATRTHLNMLLISSGYAIFFSLLPFYLLEVGLDLPTMWASCSALVFVSFSATVLFRVIKQKRALVFWRAFPGLSMALVNVVLSALNVLLWQAAWPLLTAVYWQLIVSFFIFTNLLTNISDMHSESLKSENAPEAEG
jgi:hypothetical protein